ncbi:sulfur carrier protein ThiS [Cytophagaceae bacterium ABcell3]|nr:sulfur carrier protein ThiS [Cytophagaceae bacterium ABcell3]
MEIFINNEKATVDTGKNLSDLLKDISLQETRGIAIAINNQVIPKKGWSEYALNDKDRVTIITATQGG